MKTAIETIYNYLGNKQDLIEEVRKAIENWRKMDLVVDTIQITFEQTPKYQSNPEEGNIEGTANENANN